jgi:hypothetical protein
MVQLQEQGRYGAANAQLPGQGLDIKKTASAIGHAGGLTSDCEDVAVRPGSCSRPPSELQTSRLPSCNKRDSGSVEAMCAH